MDTVSEPESSDSSHGWANFQTSKFSKNPKRPLFEKWKFDQFPKPRFKISKTYSLLLRFGH